MDVAVEGEWGTHAPGNRIVAIGRRGELDPTFLQEAFDGCRERSEAREES
jgi:hypothetical protein